MSPCPDCGGFRAHHPNCPGAEDEPDWLEDLRSRAEKVAKDLTDCEEACCALEDALEEIQHAGSVAWARKRATRALDEHRKRAEKGGAK